jgi:hypothetical protein
MFVGMPHSTLELIMYSSWRDDDWDQAHDDDGGLLGGVLD